MRLGNQQMTINLVFQHYSLPLPGTFAPLNKSGHLRDQTQSPLCCNYPDLCQLLCPSPPPKHFPSPSLSNTLHPPLHHSSIYLLPSGGDGSKATGLNKSRLYLQPLERRTGQLSTVTADVLARYFAELTELGLCTFANM